MTNLEALNNFGAIYVKEVVSKDVAHFLTKLLVRKTSYPDNVKGDEQIPNAAAIMDHELVFETLLEEVWPNLEAILDTKLLPTYAYARLYTNGDTLVKHTDRDACEISITVQLGRSHHYAWPIYMGSNRYDLAEGDGVIYRGCDIEHWRDPCTGPNGYYSGQCFLHFVFAEGIRSKEFCDSTKRQPWKNMFVMQRCNLMESK